MSPASRAHIASSMNASGPLTVLVNNAAVLRVRERRRALDSVGRVSANVRDQRLCRHRTLPGICAADGGRQATDAIVNVSSGTGELATMSTYAPAYSMSKTALNAFTRILAQPIEAGRAGERGRSRMGPHRHGRSVGAPLTSGRRRHNRLAGHAAGRWPIGRILPRSARDRMVGTSWQVAEKRLRT